MTPLLLACLVVVARPAGDTRAAARVEAAAAVRAEVALADATARMDAGDAAGALELASRADAGASSRLRFRKAAIEGRSLAALGRHAEAAAPLREARALAAAAGAALAAPLELLLARAEEESGDCRAALETLRRVGPEVFTSAESTLVQARCHLALDEPEAALADLDAALPRMPGAVELRLLRARTALALGLPLAAAADVDLLAADLDVDRLLALATEIQASGPLAARRAHVLLEAAAARFPEDPRPVAALGRALGSFSPAEAARVMRQASLIDAVWAPDAAELARAAGDRAAALRVNARHGDARARLRQRLAILVDDGAWDRVLALAPRLRAAGLADGPVIYALAYASFQAGDAPRAEALLDEVHDPAWFDRATSLRAALAACSASEDSCAR